MSDTGRILMLGSLPLGAPWNGADKVLARTIVSADTGNRFIVQTGLHDPWPNHVDAIRTPAIPTMPGLQAQVMGGRFLLSQTRRARLIHLVASIRRPSPAMAAAVRTWGRLSGRPILHSIPSLTPEQFDPRSLVGTVNVVFSEHSKQFLETLGIGAVEHVFPPVALPRTPSAAEIEAIRADLELGTLPVLYATHLDEGNGVPQAIEAFALLPRTLRDATLVLAVRWRPGEDPASRLAELRTSANEAGVSDRLRILTSVPDMAALISACALTVLVPRSLAGKMDLPLVLLESLALGRPIVVTDQPPIVEALLGGGRACPVADVPSLAAALAELLSDADLRSRLAEVGRSRVLELADPRRAVAAYDRIYDRLTAKVTAPAV